MNTIQQAYEEYVAELTRYRIWNDEVKERNLGAAWIEWDEPDYLKIQQWNEGLKIARQVLGLTVGEDMEADRRAGIKSFPVTT